jgi:glutamate--cysteine ligase
VVTIALGGLRRRARPDLGGEDERKALEPLLETLKAGRSPAERLLADFAGPWRDDIDKVFEQRAF